MDTGHAAQLSTYVKHREKETIWIFRLCVSNNCNGFFPLQSSLPFINHPIVVIKVHNSKVSLHRKDKTLFFGNSILQNKLLKMLESNKSREIHLGKHAIKQLGIKLKPRPLTFMRTADTFATNLIATRVKGTQG